MYVIHEASLQSHELYCDDSNRLLLWLGRHQLQLDDQSVFRLWVKNHQNEICQTNFDTTVLLRLRGHKQHITFCELAMRFSLCENKKAKYDECSFWFSIFQRTKTTQPIKKLFLLIDNWIANYQITKCVLHLNYANLKIQLKPSMNETRNYLVANPIFIVIFTILS